MNKKITLILVIGAACLAGLYFLNKADDVPEERSPTQPAQRNDTWWVKRHKEKLAHKKELGDVQLVFVGDSITHAWDDKGEAVWAKEFAKYKALNLGFSGDRTEHVLWRLNNGEIDGIKPKLFIVMIGTNNAGQKKEASAETAKGIKAILDVLKAKQPQAKTLLLGIFPRGATKADRIRKLNEGTNEIIKDYADDTSVFYLNINEHFLSKDGVLSESVMPDLVHPAESQYKVWAEAIKPSVEKLIEGK